MYYTHQWHFFQKRALGYSTLLLHVTQTIFIYSSVSNGKKRRLSKEVPTSEALRVYTSFDYFICNIPVFICKLDLVFCF